MRTNAHEKDIQGQEAFLQDVQASQDGLVGSMESQGTGSIEALRERGEAWITMLHKVSLFMLDMHALIRLHRPHRSGRVSTRIKP